MASGSSYKLIRGLFIFFNFLGIMIGVAMIAIGAYLYVEKNDFLNLMPKYDDVNITAVMISAGIVVFVVSFIGFCGVWMESQCMLVMFFIAIFIIFAMEIAVGIVAFIYRKDIDAEVNTQLKLGMEQPKRLPAWNKIQAQYKCCGVDKYQDWYVVFINQVPDSCCRVKLQSCGTRPDLAFGTGCYAKVKMELKDNFYVLGAAGIALGVLQILLLVMTMVLVCAIRRTRGMVA